MMRKAAFRNLGCKVNEYELEYMQQKMKEHGYIIVPFDAKSDIYVINTCTVTNIADRKSRQMIHKARKQNPDAIIVAVGCYVQTDPEGAMSDGTVDICIGNNNKAKLPEIIDEYIKNRENEARKTVYTDLSHTHEYEDMTVTETEDRERAYIKIEDGCDQFCSYCAIPYARGRVRSRMPEEIIKEARGLADAGYKEVVLTGIHISSYGIDILSKETGKDLTYNALTKTNGYTNRKLLEVIERLNRLDGIKRIRLSSLEPRLITEEFIKDLVQYEKVCPHFHLSLQSGCDDVLKRMNRKYTTEEFFDALCLIRKYYDHPAITTDVIVGFPGETEEEFKETYEFLEKCRFYEMHIFKYSGRKGTVAYKMDGQLTDAVKSERSNVLIDLSDRMSDEFRDHYVGKKVSVLFEEKKNGYYTGHTPEYLEVRMRSDEDIKGKILSSAVASNKDGMLYF